MLRFTRALGEGLLAGVMVLAMLSMVFWGFVLMGLRDALRAVRRSDPDPHREDWMRLAEAWANVMDGRVIDGGDGWARIGRDTTTTDDWHAIAREWDRLSHE